MADIKTAATTTSLVSKHLNTLKSLKMLKSATGKTSISALSKDLVLQFPVLMSAGVDQDSAITLAKSLEQNIATMFLQVWTADSVMSTTEYGTNGVRDFVRRYHNNEDIPDVVMYGGDLLSLWDKLAGNESTTVDIDSNMRVLPTIEAAVLWADAESKLSLEPINEMYLPARESAKKVNQIADAMEVSFQGLRKAINDGPNAVSKVLTTPITLGKSKVGTQTTNASGTEEPNDANAANGSANMGGTVIMSEAEQEKYTKGFNAQNLGRAVKFAGNKLGVDPNGKDWSMQPRFTDRDSQPSSAFAKFDITKNKINDLAPTILDVTFLVTGRNVSGLGGDGPSRIYQKAYVGIKTMVRFISSSYMIPNVISSIQDQSMAFKFVKWTKGEMSIGKDMLLGISKIKQDAAASNKADMWFAALRKRKRYAKTFRFAATGVNPFAILVLTKDEVDQIQQASGYNVLDDAVSDSLMNNLFLLCLMVVDSNTGLVYFKFDGNHRFATTTLKALKASVNNNADKDLADQARELRKIMSHV